MAADPEWKPAKSHWWLDWAPKFTTAVVAIAALIVAILSYLKPTATSPAPVVNNYLPDVAGATGQPFVDVDRHCSNSNDMAITGWGPDRPTVVGQQQLGWPGFNADRQNPNIGDERNMVGGRPAGSQETWTNNLQVEDGKEYRLRIYIHNSAVNTDDNVATATRIRMPLPSCQGRSIGVNGFIRSDVAFPIEVWGGVNLHADKPFRIDYAPGSAILEGNGFPGGLTLPGSDFLEDVGQLVGYDQLDGKVRGGYRDALYFSLAVRVSMQ